MQTAAVHILLKELNGSRGETLYPVPCHFENQYYAPGQLVIKKKVSVLEPRYKASKFALKNLVTLDRELPCRERLVLQNFKSVQVETAAALVGLCVKNTGIMSKADVLSHEFGLKVNGTDKLELKIENVNLIKEELDLHSICRAKYFGKIDMEHSLIRQAFSYMDRRKLVFLKRRKILCLVVGCVRADADFLVNTKIMRRMKQETKAAAENIGPTDINWTQQIGHSTTTEKSYMVRKGDILAYEMRELSIVDGELEILVSNDGRGQLTQRRGSKSSTTDPCCSPNMSISQGIVADEAIQSICLATDDEKSLLRDGVMQSIKREAKNMDEDTRNIGQAAKSEMRRMSSFEVAIEVGEEGGQYNIPLATMKKFCRLDLEDSKCPEVVDIKADGDDDDDDDDDDDSRKIIRRQSRDISNLSKLTDARVSGLEVLSKAMYELTPDMKMKLMDYSRREVNIVDELKQLIDTGSISSCSEEMADLAEDLGCSVHYPKGPLQENSAVVTLPEVPGVKAMATSALVVLFCFKSSSDSTPTASSEEKPSMQSVF